MVEKKSLDINHEKINKSRSPFLSLVHSKSTRKNPFSILINSILFNSILINSILIFGIFSTRHYKSLVEKKKSLSISIVKKLINLVLLFLLSSVRNRLKNIRFLIFRISSTL